MWFNDASVTTKNRKKNRRKPARQPILRVNARVVDKKKARTRRWKTLLVMTAAIGGTSWLIVAGVQSLGALLFSENEKFILKHVEIHNPGGKLKQRHIKEYTNLIDDLNLFDVDIRQVRKDLESVPLIKSVTVQRRVPDTLIINIIERTPVARLSHRVKGFYLAIDREGYVLGPGSQSHYLPIIQGYRQAGLGPGDYIQNDFFHDALKVLEYCDSARLTQIFKVSTIGIGNPEALEIRLENEELIYMSRHNIEAKLKNLAPILQDARKKGRQIEYADLTVSKNFPVKYR
ncbi:MAG: FtsQ-type POTRA domain-containing protein [Kiritimatiellae bacterium]|nr:FtsQ-type POTRA domain-containing protein [Kiritimatiellia bacterium]